MINWSKPRQITGETVLEQARAMERQGKGRVIDDGHPPALWVPKQLLAASPERR